MKSNTFNYSVLAVGVAALMGVSTGAMATTSSGAVSNGAAAIENMATAVYSVGTGADAVEQPPVKSNKVIVNISETANFSLVAIDGASATDEKNEDIAATPNTMTEFNHILANNGNVTDTYTIETTGNNSDIVTQEPSYALDSAPIDYIIQPIGGGTLSQEQSDALTALGQAESGTINSGGSIQLPPGLEAALSYQVDTGDKTGGDIGVGTLTATSTFISGVTDATEAQKKLINENQTIVKLPVFKIEKSATCQTKTNCNSLDLNAADTDIDYSIKVTNVTTNYSVEADNFVIRDVLPKGMTLKGNVTIPGGATVVTTGTDADGRQIIDVTVPSLAVGEDLTVSFKVEIDVPTLRAAGSATNHATVYDSYDDTTPNPDDTNSYDITDSTDENGTDPSTDNSPNVPEDADGPGTPGEDTTPTITFTDRDISITDADDQEVAVEGEVTYTHTITNNGNEDEGGTDRPIVITITDPDDTNPLSVSSPYYSTDGGTTKLPLVDNGGGTYQLPDDVILVPNTAADGETPTPGSTVEIGYTVVSDGTNADIDVTKETNTITVTPGGDFAPTVPTLTNETSIQGLKLVKLAAVVAGTDSSLTCPTGSGLDSLTFTDGTTTAIDATPFDCIVYEITATNTFTTKGLSNVTVSDDKTQWNTQASYQNDVAGLIDGSATGVTDNDTGEVITSTFATLPAEGTGTMTFSIKVNP
ncbi:hypothetical protein QL898_06010 [Psychrobacter sp. APC 3279]|uniref:hypothetical protein n=1 Tax=Psychrobacter sp. APC 3279 TaxID=3035189 RepID=UPI0025B58A45|nr:hypothetical protein [Psychrobacter sp. APC 3279]MDN3441181.1 hypothetical protein [Psychrobacter sp. APC 3279]